MIGFIVRRLLVTVPLLLVVSFVVFGLVILIPGDAAITLAGGDNATSEQIQEVREEFGFDDPFLVQYGRWLGDVVQGDLGSSLATRQPIMDEVQRRLPITLGLGLVTLGIAIPVALVTGIIGGLRPGSLVDRMVLLGTSVGLSLPNFWVGLILITIFAVQLGWLPPFGYTAFSDNPWDWLKSMLMPAFALALPRAMSLARQVRAGLAGTMESAFIRTAWAKGGSTTDVVVGHALKNSLLPAVTILGLQISAMLGGTVILEQIFSLPGMGTYLLGAVTTSDFPVIQASALLFVVVYVVVNLIVDITYSYLNPKVRTQ